MNDTTVFVGLDVHKDSITAACVDALYDAPVIDLGTVGTQQYAIDRLLKKLSGRGRLKLVYEAGPCGFWLHRYLTDKRLECVVAAPSLIPRKPGDRIKTDRRDARNLALALRAGTLSTVHVPSPDQEQFRDVVRAWQQTRHDVSGARQRLKSFLLRHDIRYTGRANWSAAHRRWLSEMVLPSAPQQIVFQELVDAINERERVGIGWSVSSTTWHRNGRATRSLKPCWRFVASRKPSPTRSWPRCTTCRALPIPGTLWHGWDWCRANTVPAPRAAKDPSPAVVTAMRAPC